MMSRNQKLIFIFIIVVFLLSRWAGLGQIYHQDEYRWAEIADGSDSSPGPHPPITLYLLRGGGLLWGFDHLRLVLFLVSLFNLFLIFALSKKVSGRTTVGLWAMGLFTISTYGLIASLQIDIDGAILPFFILGSYYAFLRWREAGRHHLWWAAVLIIMLAGGFLTKLSFFLFILALALELLWSERWFGIWFWFKKHWREWVVSGVVSLGAAVYFFLAHSGIIVEYATHFQISNFASRAYFDAVFKIFKSLVWLSPLLAGALLVGWWKPEIRKRYRLWFFYLAVNLLFYLVVFDFTTRTIERYLMFFIVPSVLIGAQVVDDLLSGLDRQKSRLWWWAGLVIFILLSASILWWPHRTLPLNPKMAYWEAVKNFDFNFLIPFSGGSGPSGFYFSASFILTIWLAVLVFWGLVVYRSRFLYITLPLLLVWGIGYNVLLSSEYLTGGFFGSVPRIARQTVNYVLSHHEIGRVITYYDTGAYELKQSGQYVSRFYTAPKRDYTERLSRFDGYYMIVDFPPISRQDRYWPLISRCLLERQFRDKQAQSFIFNCGRKI